MFQKKLLSLSCAFALGAVAARAFAASTILVNLAGAALPQGIAWQPYSQSLRPYLSVTGDASFDAAAATWSVISGTLPAGLTLDSTTGAVAGTPTTKTTSPASFTVLATYKRADGQAVYTIEVGGQVLQVSKLAAGDRLASRPSLSRASRNSGSV